MNALLFKKILSQLGFKFAVFCLLVLLACGLFAKSYIEAAQLGRRSILLGSSQPSVITTHQFDFVTTTAGTIGSIEFEYCTNNPYPGDVCSAPAGLSLSAATLNSQSGAIGFSIDASSTVNRLLITRPPAVVGPSLLSYKFGNVTNSSTANQSIYVRISTFASNDGSGPRTDFGAVVFDLSVGIGTNAYVPPWLVLCVGSVVALNCNNQENQIQDLGALTPRTTGSTTTQFSVGTNDPGGYNVFVFGPTLTSGTNTIPSLSVSQPSTRGIGQFGLNLVSNSNPAVGTNPSGAGTGAIAPGYDLANFFKFVSGDLLASSSISTDYNLFTVSYIANVDQNQQPGVYNTTMTYVGVAAF